MKLNKGKYYFYSPEEQYEFEQDFPWLSNAQMADKYGCGWRTIVRTARVLHLQKDELFRSQFNFFEFGRKGCKHPKSIATRFQKGIHHSVSTEYKKNNVPWTFGKSFYDKFLYHKLKTIPICQTTLPF